MVLPEPIGPVVNLSEKVYVPVKEFPDVSKSTSLLIHLLRITLNLSHLKLRHVGEMKRFESYKFCCVGILPSAAIYFAPSQCVHSLACPWVGELLDATVRPSPLFVYI
jgi:hypothetical protein